MDKLYSSQEVADATGRQQRTVQMLALRYKLGRKIGRDWIFTQPDIDFIAAINPLGGRPPDDDSAIHYKADPASVKKGRPKKSLPIPEPSA